MRMIWQGRTICVLNEIEWTQIEQNKIKRETDELQQFSNIRNGMNRIKKKERERMRRKNVKISNPN